MGSLTCDNNKAVLDPLMEAAFDGNVKFLRKVYKENIEDLSSYFMGRLGDGNFIHGAVKMNHCTFLSEAFQILPPEVVLELICQTDKIEGSNSLHYAAKEGNIFTVKLLVKAYLTAADALGYSGIPPWLTKNRDGYTPSHSCFTSKKTNDLHECTARYLVSKDQDLLRSLGEESYPTSPDQSTTMALDEKGASIIFYAIREGFSLLAEQVLTSGLPYSMSGINGENPLHLTPKCNDKVFKLLLERHPELIGKVPGSGRTMLDRAVEDNAVWLVELMLTEEEKKNGDTIQYCPRPWNKVCRRLIWHSNPDSFGDTPLHTAARKGYSEIAKLLVQGYKSAIRDEVGQLDVPEAHSENDHLGVSPLHIENFHKDIPLTVALKEQNDSLAVYLLSRTTLDMTHFKDGQGKSAYEIAETNNCKQSSVEILGLTLCLTGEELLAWASKVDNLHPSVKKIVRHFAFINRGMWGIEASKNVVRLVAEGLPMFEREPQKDAQLHLKEAAERNADSLVKLLLEGDNSLIIDSTPAWQIACEKGHLSTLSAFLESCYHKEFIKLCQNNQQTPLHHIKLSGYEQYRILLANPVMQELVNELDSVGDTPFHRAIEDGEIGLVKALFETEGINLNIQDQNHRTALDLLEEKLITSDNHFHLYKELLVSPLMTPELMNRVDNNGATALHRAIAQNVPRLVKTLIETEGIMVDIEDNNGLTALDMIQERCRVKVADPYWYNLCKSLLLSSNRLHPMKNRSGSMGATPLLIAIEWDDVELAKILLQTMGIKININDWYHRSALYLIENKCYENDSLWCDLYKELLINELMINWVDVGGTTPLHKAVERNATWLVKTLMWIKGVDYEIKNDNGETVVDMVKERCKFRYFDSFWFELYKEMLANPDMLQKLKNHRGSSGDTPLHLAIEWGDLHLVNKLIDVKGIEINIINKNGKTAVDLIVLRCDQYGRVWYELFKDLLANPNYVAELKNCQIGFEKDTPLHLAIKLWDIKLAKTLLETYGVEIDIEDRKGKTVLDLLQDRCYRYQKWNRMCREIRVDPGLKVFKSKYLLRRTSLKDMHNTLSIIAALLATITFAAGFAVPGGIDGKDGTATLGSYAAFLVFSVANTVAMCSSMVVLFTVIGAMIWENHHKATTLIDLCVFLLQISLCGTIVAFMTGVYAIMALKVKWAAIFTIILCSATFCVALLVVFAFWPCGYKLIYLLKGVVCKTVYGGNQESGTNQAIKIPDSIQAEITPTTNESVLDKFCTCQIRDGLIS